MPLAKFAAAKALKLNPCLAAILTATVGLGLGACGEEKKSTGTKTGDTGGTDVTPEPSGNDSNTPVQSGGGTDTGGTDTTPKPVTGTELVVTIDDVVEPSGVYAFYGAPNAGDSNAYVSILPYDYFDWVSEHDYVATPKTAKGSAARFNLTAMGVSSTSTFPFTYTANNSSGSGDAAFAFSSFDGACTNTGRRATAGKIIFESWTGTGTSTVIKGRWQGVTLFDNGSSTGKKSSAADGTFITSTAVKPRATGATIPPYSSDSAACNQPAGAGVSNGVKFN